jgi:nucleotide sugar dehydrogenase
MEKIGIIGVGKLGLVYALTFEKAGYHVWASSYKQQYVESLQRRETDSTEPGVSEMLTNSKNIVFTVDNHDVIRNCDIIYVMVATPSLESGAYDISAVKSVVNDFFDHTGPVTDKILIIGSTVNPGDCMELQQQLIPLGVHVVYSPTFAAQGTVVRDIGNPTAVSFGSTNHAVAQRCIDAFSVITPEYAGVHRMHPTTAEIMKLVGNCYMTLRINFFNTVGQLLIKSGLGDEINKANAYLNEIESRCTNLKFGFGYGGPCYPRDNRSLKHFSQQIGINNILAENNDIINNRHTDFMIEYLLEHNVDRLPFYFAYISYKPGVKIFEESQQLRVCEALLDRGCQVMIEPSKFLDHDVLQRLQQQFPNQVSCQSLQQTDQPVYEVKF